MRSLTLISVLVFGLLACKKQEEAVARYDKDVSAAMEYYNNAISNNIFKTTALTATSNPHWNPRSPKWEEASQHIVNGEVITEVPLTFKLSKTFLLQGITGKAVDPEKNNIRRLVIVKSKNGNHAGFIMTIFANDGEVLNPSSFSYRKMNKEFNGIVLFHDLNDRFINGWRYEKGKVKSKLTGERFNSTLKKNREGLSLVDPDRECWTVVVTMWCQSCTDWYVNGVYDRTACGEKYECGQFSYQECEALTCDDCGGAGTGTSGSGSSTSPESMEDCMEKASKILEAGEHLNDPVLWQIVKPETTLSNETTRTVDYKWRFYYGNFASFRWSYTSVERGVHKKVGNVWHWKSLVHFMVLTEGTTPGDTRLTLPSPLIVIQDYNRASVNLKYTITIKIQCDNGKLAEKHMSGDMTNRSYRANFVEE